MLKPFEDNKSFTKDLEESLHSNKTEFIKTNFILYILQSWWELGKKVAKWLALAYFIYPNIKFSAPPTPLVILV